MRRRTFPSWALLAALAATTPCAACAKRAEPPVLPRPAPFIAFERDFQGFRSWREVPLPTLEAQGGTHTVGRAREFVNALPTVGKTSFPVGTMIVKEVANDEKKRADLFAMVKRGSDYNASGASGWEWFELRERTDGSLAIVWRGVNAPNGESYSGDPLGGCNDCHSLARKNDFVKTPTLALGSASMGKLARGE